MIDEIMNDEEETTNDGDMGTVGDEDEKEEDASTPEEAPTEEAM